MAKSRLAAKSSSSSGRSRTLRLTSRMRRRSSSPRRSSLGKSSGNRTTKSPAVPTSSCSMARSTSGIASPSPRMNSYSLASASSCSNCRMLTETALPASGNPSSSGRQAPFCWRRRSRTASISASPTATAGLSTTNPPLRSISIRGSTSNEISKKRSSPGSLRTAPTSGSLMGRSCSLWMAARVASFRRFSSVSCSTAAP